jgi:imidazolonepropionase-like amidohydrolase
VAKIEEVRTAGLHSLELLQAAGVPMGFGTDLLGASHRLQSNEFLIRRQVLGAQQVIQSSTTTAAEILRMEGRLGRIQPGAFADLLLIRGNPLDNIACLAGNGENIPLVMKAGTISFNELTPV